MSFASASSAATESEYGSFPYAARKVIPAPSFQRIRALIAWFGPSARLVTALLRRVPIPGQER